MLCKSRFIYLDITIAQAAAVKTAGFAEGQILFALDQPLSDFYNVLNSQTIALLQVILGADLAKLILHSYAGSGRGKISGQGFAHGGVEAADLVMVSRDQHRAGLLSCFKQRRQSPVV